MSKLIVKKFGGTSVANAKRIEAVADIVQKTINDGNRVAVVLSAMGKSTDELISLAKEINPHPNPREYDALVSTGEQISVALLAMALLKRGLEGKSYTAYQLGIRTNDNHTRARILDVQVKNIQDEIKSWSDSCYYWVPRNE
jgi:aspartate kinase